MIARIWRGPVPKAKKDAYVDYIERTGLADYARIPGNRGVYLLLKDEGDEVEFITLTFWEGWDAIKAFAGEDVVKARYYPEDKDFLTRFDETVEHFEVARSFTP
jgi:heme-degrading monooxygenase HmoA